ncbi:MAG: nucleoside diphosphate kinase regulator [Syntrophorhabdaceae bacterium]|nr:nucleoside diphosphate kinase regulator [Syntrophorhabdaceae bacterium]MDD4195744.1 nucleoside diphosphate kinase regulator [Syntrophorhabdaceae bacterium]
MNTRNIYITENDLERLRLLIDMHNGPEIAPYIERLKKELDEATIIESKRVPGNVVTMNSIVRIRDINTGEEEAFMLVFPEKTGLKRKTVSILSPMGIALIGSGEGDMLEWEMPTGKVKIQIMEIIYQPERLGNYDL